MQGRMLFRASLRLSLLAALGCGGDERPEPQVATAPGPQFQYVPDEDDWGYYSADQTIWTDQPSPGFDVPDFYRAIDYRVERWLQSDGSWNVVTTFEPYAAATMPADYPYPLGVSRIETNEPQTYFRAYDLNGQELVPPATAPEVVRGNPAQPGATPSLRASSIADATTPSAGTTLLRARPRGALDDIVVTRAARERMHQALRARFGSPRRRDGRIEYYERSEAARHFLVARDSGTGLILERQFTASGRVSRQVYFYTRLASGVFVRHSVSASESRSAPRVVKQHLRRLRIARSGSPDTVSLDLVALGRTQRQEVR